MWIPHRAITVPTAGTPVQVSTTRIPAHAILIEALWTNTGRVYIGDSTLVVGTKTGLLNVLPPPTGNMFPAVSAGIPAAPNGLDLSQIWIDVQTNGEGVLVSYIQN